MCCKQEKTAHFKKAWQHLFKVSFLRKSRQTFPPFPPPVVLKNVQRNEDHS